MAVVKNVKGNLHVLNDSGKQVEGSYEPNVDGLNPKELIESSIGMCMLIVIQRILERDDIKIDEEIVIDVRANKAPDSPSRFESFDVSVQLPDELSDSYKKKLLKTAERGCTISSTVKQGAEIRIQA